MAPSLLVYFLFTHRVRFCGFSGSFYGKCTRPESDTQMSSNPGSPGTLSGASLNLFPQLSGGVKVH